MDAHALRRFGVRALTGAAFAAGVAALLLLAAQRGELGAVLALATLDPAGQHPAVCWR